MCVCSDSEGSGEERLVLTKMLGTSPRRYFEIVLVLAARYVKVRYRGSALGIFWSVLNPRIMTCVYTVVFGHAFRGAFGGSTWDYLFAVFVGLSSMNYFSSSTSQALQSVVSNGLLLNKMRLPAAAFPVATILSNTLQLALGILPILLIVAIFVGHNPLGAPLILIPLAALVLLALGAALAVSALYVFFRDIPYLYELFVFIVFVATPVFYPLSIISARFIPYFRLNPLTAIIGELRLIAIRGSIPSPVALLETLALGAIVLGAGGALFARMSPRFMDYL